MQVMLVALSDSATVTTYDIDTRTDRIARDSPRRGCISCATARPGDASWPRCCRRRSPEVWTSCNCATRAWTMSELLAVAHAARELCERHGALFVVNDRPLVARECGADGVHVGQDDMPVAQVRELVGPDMLIGLSTHAPAEIDAVSTADDRPRLHRCRTRARNADQARPSAVGVELVRHAAAHASVPWFAIGGLRCAQPRRGARRRRRQGVRPARDRRRRRPRAGGAPSCARRSDAPTRGATGDAPSRDELGRRPRLAGAPGRGRASHLAAGRGRRGERCWR